MWFDRPVDSGVPLVPVDAEGDRRQIIGLLRQSASSWAQIEMEDECVQLGLLPVSDERADLVFTAPDGRLVLARVARRGEDLAETVRNLASLANQMEGLAPGDFARLFSVAWDRQDALPRFGQQALGPAYPGAAWVDRFEEALAQGTFFLIPLVDEAVSPAPLDVGDLRQEALGFAVAPFRYGLFGPSGTGERCLLSVKYRDDWVSSQVNRDYLLAVKRKGRGRTLQIERVRVLSLKEPYDYLLRGILEEPDGSVRGTFALIEHHKKLKRLLKYSYSFCQAVHRPYQGLWASDHLVEAVKDDSISWSKFRTEMLDRMTAAVLEEAYDDCEQDDRIVAHSHRRLGWKMYEYEASEEFQFTIRTNFGYGSSSYFLVSLIFKGLEILPFSKWVLYRFARYSDIIRCSAEYAVADESWKDCFSYCIRASNLAAVDEKAFVRAYVVDECERMVQGLEALLVGDRVDFHKVRAQSEEGVFEGFELADLRGEKISGALDFISHIIEFKSVAEVTSFARRIEDCARRVIRMLDEQLILIGDELEVISPTYFAADAQARIIGRWFEAHSVAYDAARMRFLAAAGLEQEPASLDSPEVTEPTEAWFENSFGITLSQIRRDAVEAQSGYEAVAAQQRALFKLGRKLRRYRQKIRDYFAAQEG